MKLQTIVRRVRDRILLWYEEPYCCGECRGPCAKYERNKRRRD